MKTIVNGVRAEGKTYLPGDETALAEACTPEQIERLAAKGAIAGDWGQTPKEEFVPETKPAKRGK